MEYVMSFHFSAKNLKDLEGVYGEMTVRQLRVLSFVADNPHCLMVDVVRGADLPQSVCSRTIRLFLCDAVNSKNLGLIDQISHPTDGRKNYFASLSMEKNS